MSDAERDPWKTSIHGIKIMEPWEDELWKRFERRMVERHGYGWSVEIEPKPLPSKYVELIERLAQAHELGRAEEALAALLEETR